MLSKETLVILFRSVGTIEPIDSETVAETGVAGSIQTTRSISHSFFADYFLAREKAAALCLGKVFKLSRPVSLDELPTDRVAPQSFFYLTPEDLSFLSTFSDFEPEDEPGEKLAT